MSKFRMAALAIFLLIGLFGRGSAAPGREFPGLSYKGPSGLVLVPTGQIIKAGWMGFGIHRGIIKISYGAFGVAEMGIASPDVYEDPNREDWRRETTGFFKVALPWEERNWTIPGLAVGAENSLRQSQETYYAAATWHGRISEWPVELTLGFGSGRFCQRIFAGLGVIPVGLLGRTVKVLAEFAGEKADAGLRLALSRSLRLDFVMLIDAMECSETPDPIWRFRIERGMPGASMAAHVRTLKRLIVPEKKKP